MSFLVFKSQVVDTVHKIFHFIIRAILAVVLLFEVHGFLANRQYL